MTDKEMYDVCVERCKNLQWQQVVSAEIIERVNDTTYLQIQIRRIWAAVITISIIICIFVLAALTGCATPPRSIQSIAIEYCGHKPFYFDSYGLECVGPERPFKKRLVIE